MRDVSIPLHRVSGTSAVHSSQPAEPSSPTWASTPFSLAPSTTSSTRGPSTPTSATSTSPSTSTLAPSVNADWLLLQHPAPAIASARASTAPPATSLATGFEAHSARMAELEQQRRTMQAALDTLENRLATIHTQIDLHATFIAEQDAKFVLELPPNYKKQLHPRTFECLGWRATADCDPNGKRLPSKDRACRQPVPSYVSGYCEIQDSVTKERFRVMKTACSSLRGDATLRCLDARDFPNFAIHASHVVRNITKQRGNEQSALLVENKRKSRERPRGIALVVYPKLLPSAYATLRTLRRLNCSLPVELWYKPNELVHANNHPIVHEMVVKFGPVTLRAIDDIGVRGYATKIHAIRHSQFGHVLFLDADNVPVKDPSYLFELPQYARTGALFWPDFWHPHHTIFALHDRSLVWEYLDLEFIDMFEQESGQLVVDTTRHQAALALLRFYAHHQPNLLDSFKLVHGDKDLFRFAWIKSNSSFHMVAQPPAVAGNLIGGTFCGQTMGQFDPDGELLFLHRNARKLEGRHAKKKASMVAAAEGVLMATDGHTSQLDTGEEEVDPEIWTHLLQFKPTTSSRADYKIEIYQASSPVHENQWCYGKKSLPTPHFDLTRFVDLPFRNIESDIRAFAIEATNLLSEIKVEATMQP